MKTNRIVRALLAPGLIAVSISATAQGDAARGQQLYESRCIGCHSLDSNRVGPAHRGVFGRRAGSLPDFEYSEALKRTNLIWTAMNLDRWLSNPERALPGQKMGYRVDDPGDRADLIAYLRSTSAAGGNR